MEINVRLLRRIEKHILAEPRRFLMRVWIVTKEETGKDKYYGDKGTVKFARCGTAACIGGWACLLADGKIPEESTWISARAKELLGIEDNSTARLFSTNWWPEPFRSQFMNAKFPRTRAKIAVARIEHYIKTKGKDV